MKHISEIIQLEALVIRIVYVCCVDTNEYHFHVLSTLPAIPIILFHLHTLGFLLVLIPPDVRLQIDGIE